ncbi:hypothetical protein [Oceanicaulis sp.]|uniref:hypothetical protein n=1 Tax=Oceanicaulis sp. TaxID=1924941 RepID=UPI003D2A3EBC
MTQPITPHQAQERERKASPGRKWIVRVRNREGVHAALRHAVKRTEEGAHV